MNDSPPARRPPSLALRLTLLFGITAATVFAGFGWFIGRALEDHFETGDVRELEVIAQAVRDTLSDTGTNADLAMLQRRFDDLLIGHHSAALYVAGEDGQTLYASPGPDLTGLVRGTMPGGPGRFVQTWSEGGHSYRALILSPVDGGPAGGRRYSLAVTVPIDYHLSFLARFRYTLWIMVASAILVTGLMGWIVVRRGLAPLHHIVARIRRISTRQLHTRLSPEAVPRELVSLAESFNELLGRMEEAFQRLANFSADIAHELRTPITNLMTQTQVALARARTVEEYREILYSNIEEYERMAQMIGEMLFLAQSDDGLRAANVTEVDLGQEVRDLFDYYEAWAEEHGVTLALEGGATLSGDRPMLRRALGNLLSNAIRHTPSGQCVTVRLAQTRDNRVCITVENPGTPIPPEHIPRLFDRFYRIDPARQRHTEGGGLGLAIVKAIVDAHQGRIEVRSGGGRTRFQVTLPLRPATRA